MKRKAHILLSLIGLLWAARAEAAKVIIVRSAGASPALNETLSRLQGEVLSLGLEVAIVERPTPSGANAADARAWVERMAIERDADAVLDVIGAGAPAAVDIWVFQGQPRRAEVSRVVREPDADNAAERLAIRTIEALRSNLVEIDLVAKGAQAKGSQGAKAAKDQRQPTVARQAAAAVTLDARREPAEPPGHVDLQAGAALLTSLDGVGPAVMPIVRVGWTATSWLMLQGALAGLGSRPSVTSAAGSARVAERYAVVGGCTCVRSARALQPYVALSAGVLRTTIDGQADAPADAHVVERWSFLVDGSVGARLRLPDRYHLTLAAHVQVAQPYIAIHFVDTLVATSGRPNLLLTLTVGAWL